jgi:hypothetical protein
MNVLPEVMPAFAEPAEGNASRRLSALSLPVSPLEQPGWDSLVAEHPQATFFHGAAWARVLRDTYGHTPTYFCKTSRGQLEALLPVMEVSSPLTGRRGVGLPFTDMCPALGASADLFEQAMEYGQGRRWKYLECRGGISQFNNATPSLDFHGHVLDLTGGEAAMLQRAESSVRRAIRKAEQAGLTVEFGNDLAAMRTYFDLHCQTRQRHGLPPQPFRFFENISRHVIAPGHGWVVSVEQAGRTVASAIFFHFAGKAIYKFGASDFAFQQARPNNLLMWAAMKWYAAHDCKTLHLGRTSASNDGLRRFKLGLGAVEETIQYCRYDYSRRSFVTGEDRVKGWFNSFFRAMPQPMLRLAGRTLYPHLS